MISAQTASLSSVEVEPFISEDVVATNSDLTGACGLYNIGNTCYMNSTLQCLLHNEALQEYFLSTVKIRLTDASMLQALNELFEKYWSGKWSTIVPRNFKKQIDTKHSQFSGSGQHDGQEFLALFLASLHQELKQFQDGNNAGESIASEDKISRKRTGSYIDDSMPNNKRVDSCSSNKQYLTIKSLIGKEKKTANVNVLNADVECNEEITTDHSTKFPQADIRPKFDCNAEDILMNNQMLRETKYPESTNFVEQIKDLKLRQLSGLSCKETNVLADIKRHEKESLPSTSCYDDVCKNHLNVTMDQECSEFKPLCSSSVDCKDNCSVSLDIEKAIDYFLAQGDAPVCTAASTNELPEPSFNKDVCVLIDDLEEIATEIEVIRTITPEPLDSNDDLQDNASNIRGDISGMVPSNPQSIADEMWQKYIEQNRSIIIDTLQGQMESTVVCCKCSHKSTTYEPFMYLSVPIPHALLRLIHVRLIPLNGLPSSHSLYVMKDGRVSDLYESLFSQLQKTNPIHDPTSFCLCEVKDLHILKVVDKSTMLKSLNTVSRQLEVVEFLSKVKSDEDGHEGSSSWNSCCICLEDLSDCELLKHQVESCSVLMCHACLQNSTAHYGLDNFTCPICHMRCCPATDFLPISNSNQSRDVIVTVNFTFRRNNTVEIVASSKLLRLTTSLSSSQLYEYVRELIPDFLQAIRHEIVFCTQDGLSCSRCDVTSSCFGCHTVSMDDGDITMHPGDNICLRFFQLPDVIPLRAPDLVELDDESKVTLNMCLSMFSEKEILDSGNPWYCPACQSHQLAEKKLKICRWPETLIVYIKRFLYHSKTPVKVDDEVLFPLEDFDPGPVSGTAPEYSKTYDLNSCVAHYGGVYSGHYTSFCKHRATGKWVLFNDEKVTYQEPSSKDANAVYILFYKEKRNMISDISI